MRWTPHFLAAYVLLAYVGAVAVVANFGETKLTVTEWIWIIAAGFAVLLIMGVLVTDDPPSKDDFRPGQPFL